MKGIAALAAIGLLASSAGFERPAASQEPVANKAHRNGCTTLYTRSQFHKEARRVFRGSQEPSEAKSRRIRLLVHCQADNTSERLTRAHAARYRRAQARRYYWPWKQARIPSWLKATLARLRGCETRGVRYPLNYQYSGHHQGAYQYDGPTWREAQGYAGVPHRRRTSVANWASPAQQDVVTAKFFPSHRGRWACRA